MPMIINPGKRFAEKAKLTAPANKNKYGIPRNTRESIAITKVHSMGIFQLEADEEYCLYDRAFIFSDINYINRDSGEKNRLLDDLIRFLNFMNTDFKITVASEYLDMNSYINEIFSDINRDRYPDISDGMRDWIEQKVAESDIQNLKRVLYLTITTRARSYEEARSYFLNNEIELMTFFTAMHSQIRPLKTRERLECLQRFFYRDEYGKISQNDVSDPILDVIPYSVDASYRDFMVFNDKQYVSVLFARDVGSPLVDEQVLQELTKVSFPSFCTIDYAPVEKSLLRAKLKGASISNERAIAQEIDMKRRNGQMAAGISYTKARKKDELERYIDQIDDNDEACILAGLMVVITANSEEELARRIETMKENAKGVSIYLETYNYVQLKAFNTALPIGCRHVNAMRAYLTSSLVAMHPFYAQDLIEEGGQLYGINKTTNHLVFANRKKLKSPHGMIVGHTGGGKSFLMKETEVAQTLLSTDDDLTMIDPQNEMEVLCSLYGGQFLDFTPKSKIYVNPMEIPESLFEKDAYVKRDSFVADVTEWANSFCEAAMKGIIFTQEYRSMIGRAVRAIYERIFAKGKCKVQPTLKELRAELAAMEKSCTNDNDALLIHRIYNAIEEYTEGAYDMFAHQSNVDMNNRFVVFGLANVSENLWEPAMITIMFYLSNRMEYNKKLQRATRFVIDETQVVTENPSSAKILLKAVITYRKFGGICTMALQNISRAFDNPELRDMFSNCGYKCFLDQGGVDAQRLAEIQEFSQAEFKALTEDVAGRGVMIWGKKVILLDSRMDENNILYRQFSTNFHEDKSVGEDE